MNDSYYKIITDLENAGIKKGDDVLIHSSFKSLGYVEGGIETLITALLHAVGDTGTLLFPALSYKTVNSEESGFTFDVRTTPSCIGAIPEFFRTYNGVTRSIHPTHSVSVYGFRKDEYVKNHTKDHTPVGENSPFALLPHFGGKVLMLGCKVGSNTSMHGVEEKANAPYVLSDETRKYTVIDYDGNVTTTDNRYHDMQRNGFAQRYDRLQGLMEFKKCKILEAECHIIDCETMWKTGTEKIIEDPYYFTDKIENGN